jgi:hypothetical protein
MPGILNIVSKTLATSFVVSIIFTFLINNLFYKGIKLFTNFDR